MADQYEHVLDTINEMMDQSYGCAESFVAAVGEYLWDEIDDQIKMISTGFSGGVGGTHEELCGGVSGAAIIAGMIYGRTTADEAKMIRCKRVIATHRDSFVEMIGDTRCQVLRDAQFGADERNPCSAIIGPSAKMLIDLLREEEEADKARAQEHHAWIGERLAELGDPRPGTGLLPGGVPDILWHAIDGGDIEVARAGQFTVEPFYLVRYLLTMRQYTAFLADPDGFTNDAWWQGLDVEAEHRAAPGEQRFALANNPRENVSWFDAVAFCRWLTAQYRALPEDGADSDTFSEVLRLVQREGWQIRLPTEWEWQRAATGGQPDNTFPWGADWEDGRAHTKHNQLDRSMAVGMYPQGVSLDGVFDMSGNVWEWCLNNYEEPAQPPLPG